MEYKYFLASNITPNKNYQYWHFAQYGGRSYSIIQEGGDTLLRKRINKNVDILKRPGIFVGGDPGYISNYIVTIDDDKISYVRSEDGFRTFLGQIDNLEEALLLAKSYGYYYYDKSKYREAKNGYELLLLRSYGPPETLPFTELVSVTITKDGYIKTQSLGIHDEWKYCE
jgi:hypothetical protein